MKKVLHFLLLIFNVLLVIITVGVLLLALFSPAQLEHLFEWFGGIVRTWGKWNYLSVFCFASIESLPFIGTAVPGQNILIITAGFFGPTDPWGTALCAALGACAGNGIGYVIGKKHGPWLLQTYGDWFGIGKTEVRYLEKMLHKGGFLFLFLGKFHNLFRSIIPFLAGAVHMHPKRFWLFNLLGSCLWAICMVVLGIYAILYYKVILKNVDWIFLGLVAIVALYSWFFRKEHIKKYWAEKKAEIDNKYS